MKRYGYLVGYLIPFAFLGLCADMVYGWDWAWLLLGAAAILLGSCVGGDGLWLGGNGLSLGVSALCVQVFGFWQYNHYFKPLGATGFVVLFYGVTMLLTWLIRKKEWLILGLLLAGGGAVILALYSLQAGL